MSLTPEQCAEYAARLAALLRNPPRGVAGRSEIAVLFLEECETQEQAELLIRSLEAQGTWKGFQSFRAAAAVVKTVNAKRKTPAPPADPAASFPQMPPHVTVFTASQILAAWDQQEADLWRLISLLPNDKKDELEIRALAKYEAAGVTSDHLALKTPLRNSNIRCAMLALFRQERPDLESFTLQNPGKTPPEFQRFTPANKATNPPIPAAVKPPTETPKPKPKRQPQKC